MHKLIGTHLIALYVNDDNGSASYNVTYFEMYGAEHIPKEIKKFIGNKNTIISIYRIQAYDSIMCGYFWILLDLLFYVKRWKFVRICKFIFS